MRTYNRYLTILACCASLLAGASCKKAGAPEEQREKLSAQKAVTPFTTDDYSELSLSVSQLSTPAALDPGNVLANLLDGNTSTRWSGEGNPQYLYVRLNAVHTIGLLKLAFHTANSSTRTSNFDVALSTDSINWTTVISNQNSTPNITALQSFEFTATDAKYIRITGHGNSSSNWNSYTELEIWGITAGVIDLTGDWETGNASQWDDGIQAKSVTDQFAVVTSPVRQGNYAAQFTVRPGDKICKYDDSGRVISCSSGERCEANRWNYDRELPGDEFYYGWSTQFPAGWQEPSGWAIFMQWHAHSPISPPIAFGVKNGNIRLEMCSGAITGTTSNWWPLEYNDNYTIAPVNVGLWHDFIVRIRFSPDSITGLIKVWHRLQGETEFTQILNLNVPTLQWRHNTEFLENNYRLPYTRYGTSGYTTGTYVKHGLYRGDGNTFTSTIYQDNWHRGTSFDAIRATF